MFIGEIGLSGELRPVNDIEKRIYEAQKLGFKRAVIPASNKLSEKFDGIKIIEAKRILDALTSAVVK